MKKYILLLVCAASFTACKKVPAGGNKDAIKMTEGVVRYSDENAPKPTYVEKTDTTKAKMYSDKEPMKAKDSVVVRLPETK